MKAIICDLDGTLCDCTHRRHFLDETPPNWEKFHYAMNKDRCVKPVAHVLSTYKLQGFKIILCSGRPEEYRITTQYWCTEYNIPYDLLLMRPTGDSRKDSIIKKEMLAIIQEDYDVLFVLDDRQQVVDMWRENGLTCFQVAPGDFDLKKGFMAEKPGKLTLMVGPSGSGKSTYAASFFPKEDIISSDLIRHNLCGDFRDQSKNDRVFQTLHNLVKARLEAGFDCVIDATNIRDKDRRSIRELAQNNSIIEYIVIDRPLEEKIRDGGWRNEVIIREQTLIERHAEVFKMNLKAILAGDYDKRVKVIDLRR